MRIVLEPPPIFDEIVRVFPRAGEAKAIFCYGELIYNPRGIEVTKPLLAHEKVHSERQGREPAAWWRRYLDDPEFRLNEEIPAHRAEWRRACDLHNDRNRRAVILERIAIRLASPLYGNLIDHAGAKRAICGI